MSRYLFLTGTCKWAKLDKPDEKYGNYTIDLYLDKGSMKQFKESGLGLKIRDNEEGTFIKLRRDPERVLEGMPEKPRKLIYDAEKGEYLPFEALIGNGSTVNCKVEVYDSQKGKGHRLEAVAVENLVPYGDEEDQDLPF